MGHRCTLAIKEDNAVELFYGHWTGVELPEQLFWGPEYVEAYIRGHEAADFWMEDLFADGCVGLDKDQKLLLVHRGSGRLSKGTKSAYFYVLMRALWEEQGWRVQQVKQMAEIAVHMGYPAEVAQWVPDPQEPWPLETITDTLREDGWIGTLITTPSAKFGAVAPWDALLANGPDLLAHLAHFPQVEEGKTAEAIVHLDPVSREISVRGYNPYTERYFPYLEQFWPGWTFRFTPPEWLFEEEDDEEDEEDEDPTDFRQRVLSVLLSEPYNLGPGFIKALSMIGDATIAPGAETGPPRGLLSMEKRAEILAIVLEIVSRKGLDSL